MMSIRILVLTHIDLHTKLPYLSVLRRENTGKEEGENEETKERFLQETSSKYCTEEESYYLCSAIGRKQASFLVLIVQE